MARVYYSSRASKLARMIAGAPHSSRVSRTWELPFTASISIQGLAGGGSHMFVRFYLYHCPGINVAFVSHLHLDEEAGKS